MDHHLVQNLQAVRLLNGRLDAVVDQFSMRLEGLETTTATLSQKALERYTCPTERVD